jgi:hypothetical protein
MTPTDTQRLIALEAENARLRSEVERLKPAPRVLRIGDPFSLPSEEQVERLIRRVFAKHPILRPVNNHPYPGGDIGEDEFTKMVRASMQFVASLYRTRGATNRTKSYLDWLLSARDHLTTVGCGMTTIRGPALYVGCLCANDVPVSPPRLWPQCEIGLSIGPGSGRYSASNKWLALLGGSDPDPSLIIEPPAATLHSPRTQFEAMGHVNWRQQ